MSLFPRWFTGKPHAGSGSLVAVLDIGTSKIVCLIASFDEDGLPTILGFGHSAARGMRAGAVIDLDALQRSIVATVSDAERMAGVTIKSVTVSISGAQLVSRNVEVGQTLNGRALSVADLERVLNQAQNNVMDEGDGAALDLIHTIPIQYILDGQKGIRYPVGMIGDVFQAHVNIVMAPFGLARTLATAVARCHLDVERLVVAPYASGISSLVEDEKDLGCTIIDCGAGTTSLSIFFDGQMIFADGVPLGGANITNDIARGLTTSVAQAERLKTLFGSASVSLSDESEMIEVPQVGEDAPGSSIQVPRSHLVSIIQPRIEEIFELVRSRLDKSGQQGFAGRRVVLTGGASQMVGIREVAQRILDRQVRLGRPLRLVRSYEQASPGLVGLPESMVGSAFSTVAGLLAFAHDPDRDPALRRETRLGGLWERVGGMFKIGDDKEM